MRPSLEGFTTFLREVVCIPDGAFPSDFAVKSAYAVAKALTPRRLLTCGPYGKDLYERAVYDCGAHNIIVSTPDTPTTQPPNYWANTRQENGSNFVPGFIQSASDTGTSGSLVVPDIFRKLNAFDAGMMTTIWGRDWEGLVQSLGPAWAVASGGY